MSQRNFGKTVTDHLATYFGIDSSSIKDGQTLSSLGIDKRSFIDFCVNFERRTDLSIPDHKFEAYKTVAALISAVQLGE